MIVPAEDDDRLARAAAGLARELEDGLPGFHLTIGHSRRAADPVDLYRAGNEARLAVNVGEAEEPRAARLRGHRRLPPAAAGDQRGPAGARALLRGDRRPALRLRRAVRDRARRDRRGLPRQRRQRRRHRQTALHPPPHDPLPPGAGQGALRPRRLGDRGPREARPRPEGDARARHRLAPRPGPRAGRRSGPGAALLRGVAAAPPAGAVPGEGFEPSLPGPKPGVLTNYTTPDRIRA